MWCNSCCNAGVLSWCREHKLMRKFDMPTAIGIKVRPHAEETQLAGLAGEPARSRQDLWLAQPQTPGTVSARAGESPRLRSAECPRVGAEAESRPRHCAARGHENG